MPTTSTLRLRIFDGTRQLFAAPAKFLVTITDGNQAQHFRNYIETPDTTFTVPFFDNLGDNYTVLVWAEGFRQAGFTPVKLSDSYTRVLDLMLIAKDPGFSFVGARFPAAQAKYPFIGAGLDNPTGEASYDKLVEEEKPLACLLNICEAMSQIALPSQTPLAYMKQLIWDGNWDGNLAPAQDRFFAWCDPVLIQQIETATADGKFSVEQNPGLFHPGATRSWKQIQFGEANVQLTFHENEKPPTGTNWVMVEPDIDYYQDLAAHAILEVIPNAITKSLTDPVQVYVLRWIDGQTSGIPEFKPLYTIT
jgi:hypothetical protein